MLRIKLRALTTLFLLSVSALLSAQDFYFENELSFRLDRKCAGSELIPNKVFQETEEIFLSSTLLPTISGDNYKLFCNELAKPDFSFDSILISNELFDNHIAYYAHFNGLWQEMWAEDSAFAVKSNFYKLKLTIDSCIKANPTKGVTNTFLAFSKMPEALYFIPFYRNLLLNWAVVAYFEPKNGIPVALPKSLVYNLSTLQQNVLAIRINSNDEIFIGANKSEYQATLAEVKSNVIKHITNEGKDTMFAISSEKAIVSLNNERGTSYSAYVDLYNEIVSAYNLVWNEYAQKVYKQTYNKLPNDQQKIIKAKYPRRIAEAEPVSVNR